MDQEKSCTGKGSALLLAGSLSLNLSIFIFVHGETRAIPYFIATLTTVGYGDVFPITSIGKLIASLTAIIGIGLFALPTGILCAGFIEEFYRYKEKEKKRCQHCGKNL